MLASVSMSIAISITVYTTLFGTIVEKSNVFIAALEILSRRKVANKSWMCALLLHFWTCGRVPTTYKKTVLAPAQIFCVPDS